MFVHTDIPEARWNVVESEDKKRARINMIAHLLGSIPYQPVEHATLKLPKRPASTGCLLYTSDAADDLPCVDIGGCRIIKKKNKLP